MSESGRADPERVRLIRRVFEPSTLDDVAEAVSVATEYEDVVYVERVPGGWRWSLAHRGGPYPLLRISARFLKMDWQSLWIGCRSVDGLSILCENPSQPHEPLQWAFLHFEGPASIDEVRSRIVDVLGLE